MSLRQYVALVLGTSQFSRRPLVLSVAQSPRDSMISGVFWMIRGCFLDVDPIILSHLIFAFAICTYLRVVTVYR